MVRYGVRDDVNKFDPITMFAILSMSIKLYPLFDPFLILSGCNIIRTCWVRESIRKAIEIVLPLHGFCCFSHLARFSTTFSKDKCNKHKIRIGQKKESLNGLVKCLWLLYHLIR